MAENRRDTDPTSDPAAKPSLSAMLALLSGHSIVRSIAVVAELGIPDLLVAGPKTAAELARECGAHESSLFRLLRALAAQGVFEQTGTPERFGLTALSSWLRSDTPGTLRDFARLRGGPLYWGAWGALDEAVKTGKAAFEYVHGASHFAYLDQHPDAERAFSDAMLSLSSQIHAAVIQTYDFSQLETIIDVGGGSGATVAALLNAHPQLQATLFDRPDAIERSAEVLKARGVLDRCRRVSGDFFQFVPPGSEAALLSRVIHDFDDNDALRILRNCRAALPSGGKLIIVEYVLSDDAAGVPAKLFDLQMLVLFGHARERTAEEFRALLEQAGFSLTRVQRTPASISVLEAVADGRPR
jgi:precorrin-6B methylase 2